MEKGVNGNWTEADEARWNELMGSIKSFPMKHILLLFQAVVKYDLRTVPGRRAINRARLRLATATDDDLQDMAEVEVELFGRKSTIYADVSVNLERLKEMREAAKSRLKEEVAHGDARRGL